MKSVQHKTYTFPNMLHQQQILNVASQTEILSSVVLNSILQCAPYKNEGFSQSNYRLGAKPSFYLVLVFIEKIGLLTT